jgi:hypothetical protein
MSTSTLPRLLAVTLITSGLVACEGGEMPSGKTQPPASDGGASGGWSDSGGGAGYADQGGWLPPSADGEVAQPASDGAVTSSCPEVGGDWAGTVEGQITGSFNMTVGGTLTMTLSPQGAPGDYIVSGGEMSVAAQGLEAFPFKYAVNGSVKCGVLTATNTVDIFGVKSTGSVTCTFTAQGCQGTWDGQTTDGSSKGSGTFQLQRKP